MAEVEAIVLERPRTDASDQDGEIDVSSNRHHCHHHHPHHECYCQPSSSASSSGSSCLLRTGKLPPPSEREVNDDGLHGHHDDGLDADHQVNVEDGLDDDYDNNDEVCVVSV